MEEHGQPPAGIVPRRGDVLLGDLVRATVRLMPDDTALASLVSMLSLDRLRPVSPALARSAPSLRPKPPAADAPGVTHGTSATARPEPSIPASGEPGRRLAPRLREVPRGESGSIDAPAWLFGARIMPAPPSKRIRRQPEPLLDRRRRRALLGATLASWTADGAPDLERLVEMGARMQVVTRVPRRTIPTLRRGAQVLVDLAPALMPYRYDVEDALSAVSGLLTDDRLEVMRFIGCPTRSVAGRGLDEWSKWRPPPRGTPVLVLSDLGIGGSALDPDRASTAEWRAFSATAARARTPIVALVPFGKQRWPVELTRGIAIVEWDVCTGVAAIRRAVRTNRDVAP